VSRLLLLHVDDDPDEGFLLARALRKSDLGRWDYHYLPSGQAAIEYLSQTRNGEAALPTLAVLDVKMPMMSGLEVLEWMAENLIAVPAVMLSSSELLDDRLRARNLGSRGYFSKSATFSELVEFLQHWNETALATKGVVTTPASAREF
jgi:CheY-like chemotaxis protein